MRRRPEGSCLRKIARFPLKWPERIITTVPGTSDLRSLVGLWALFEINTILQFQQRARIPVNTNTFSRVPPDWNFALVGWLSEFDWCSCRLLAINRLGSSFYLLLLLFSLSGLSLCELLRESLLKKQTSELKTMALH